MSIPNEALQKLVQEIESKSLLAQREISVVKSAIAAKQRDVRLLDLTSTEMKSLAESVNVYEGVGRMFVLSQSVDVEKRLSSETAELKSEISNLNKKLQYLETTHKNSREHIDRIFNSGRG